MEDIKESTKGKSKVVTSRTKVSRQTSNVSQNIRGGPKPPTDESEKIRDLLARMLDLTHNWPIRMMDGGMPLPYISSEVIVFAFPVEGRHVIQNYVTSDGRQNFTVDGLAVIPDIERKGELPGELEKNQ